MQWDKVKNVLIAILLTINLFLLGNLAVRGWQSHRRTSELEANLRTLVSARGMQLDTAFSFPEDITLPELSLDRSRADEEKIAAAMLGEHAERTEQEDGTVRFESDRGTLEWQADGNVQADYTLTESAPTSASEALEQARRLCSRWGFQAEQAGWTAEDTVVTLTGSVAGLPVHNRPADTGLFCRRRLGVARRTVELRHAVHHRERHQHYLQRSRCSAAVCRRKRRNRYDRVDDGRLSYANRQQPPYSSYTYLED